MTMDKTRFQELADAYGGDMARWPQEARAHGQAWRAANEAQAAAILAQARALDAALDTALDTAPAAPPSPQLYARILAGVPAPQARARWTLADLWSGVEHTFGPRRSIAGLAAALVLGLSLGFASERIGVSSDAQLEAFDLAQLDYDDVFSLEGL